MPLAWLALSVTHNNISGHLVILSVRLSKWVANSIKSEKTVLCKLIRNPELQTSSHQIKRTSSSRPKAPLLPTSGEAEPCGGKMSKHNLHWNLLQHWATMHSGIVVLTFLPSIKISPWRNYPASQSGPTLNWHWVSVSCLSRLSLPPSCLRSLWRAAQCGDRLLFCRGKQPQPLTWKVSSYHCLTLHGRTAVRCSVRFSLPSQPFKC